MTTVRDLENDWNILLKVFPEEIWIAICDNLLPDDAQTLENAWNSSPVFNSILHSKRTTFLFPEVWKHIAQYLEPSPSYRWSEIKDCQTTVLKFRTVCKTWCNAVDNYYRTLPTHRHTRENVAFSKHVTFHPRMVDVLMRSTTSPWVYEYFLDHFASTHANSKRSPFIVNAVRILFCSENPLRQRTMELYGHHIWHCSLSIGTHSSQSWYEPVRQILLRLTNLRTLSMILWKDSAVNQQELQREIMRNPLPHFPHLTDLYAHGFSTAMMVLLFVNNKHVRVKTEYGNQTNE